MVPSEWRKAVGLPGNAPKMDVAHISEWNLLNSPLTEAEFQAEIARWPQDAHDAHLIALATASLIDQREAA
jgi:hypothetical protein